MSSDAPVAEAVDAISAAFFDAVNSQAVRDSVKHAVSDVHRALARENTVLRAALVRTSETLQACSKTLEENEEEKKAWVTERAQLSSDITSLQQDVRTLRKRPRSRTPPPVREQSQSRYARSPAQGQRSTSASSESRKSFTREIESTLTRLGMPGRYLEKLVAAIERHPDPDIAAKLKHGGGPLYFIPTAKPAPLNNSRIKDALTDRIGTRHFFFVTSYPQAVHIVPSASCAYNFGRDMPSLVHAVFGDGAWVNLAHIRAFNL